MKTEEMLSNHALVRWALQTRALQDRARRDSKGGSELQMWLIRPAKEVVAGAALLVLTYLAGALRPRLLYAANGIPTIDATERPMFLDYRLFILSLIASAELVTDQSLIAALKEEDPEFASLPQVWTRVLFPLMIFLIISLGALHIWISARFSKTPLTITQSMRVSGYGIGVVFITLLTVVPLIIAPLLFSLRYISSSPISIQFDIISIILVLFYIACVYIQFVGPVSAYYPNASRSRLLLGWFMGLLLLPLGLGLVFSLVFLLVLGIGFISGLG